MAFVCEKVNEEEVEKFELNELWNKYHQSAFIRLPQIWGFDHYWVVDRERESWVYNMSFDEDDSSMTIYLLHYKERNIEIRTKGLEGNSTQLDDDPFIERIDFVSAHSEFINEFDIEEIKTVFKEGLVAYLTDRFSTHPNYILECNW